MRRLCLALHQLVFRPLGASPQGADPREPIHAGYAAGGAAGVFADLRGFVESTRVRGEHHRSRARADGGAALRPGANLRGWGRGLRRGHTHRTSDLPWRGDGRRRSRQHRVLGGHYFAVGAHPGPAGARAEPALLVLHFARPRGRHVLHAEGAVGHRNSRRHPEAGDRVHEDQRAQGRDRRIHAVVPSALTMRAPARRPRAAELGRRASALSVGQDLAVSPRQTH
mmetsp:Transcript_95717/g.275833  ORF Transcript_95717/g.275833 Transcript_95717/m.275833 type:complete len:225 (+) Transcript_95717:867-1541(+)